MFLYRFRDLKVVMIGDASVGKTCLVLRYIDRQFQESISVRCFTFAAMNIMHIFFKTALNIFKERSILLSSVHVQMSVITLYS